MYRKWTQLLSTKLREATSSASIMIVARVMSNTVSVKTDLLGFDASHSKQILISVTV